MAGHQQGMKHRVVEERPPVCSPSLLLADSLLGPPEDYWGEGCFHPEALLGVSEMAAQRGIYRRQDLG